MPFHWIYLLQFSFVLNVLQAGGHGLFRVDHSKRNLRLLSKMEFFNILCSILEFGWPTFILGTILLLLLFRVFTTETVANLPPTVGFRFPLIGHLLQFVESDKRIPLRKFREKIGNMYSLYVGQQLMIIVAGQDLIKEMLRRHEFINKPYYPLDRLQKVKHLGKEKYTF